MTAARKLLTAIASSGAAGTLIRTAPAGAMPHPQPNVQRGEIAAKINGQTRILCLTLGALAELEAALDASDLVALVERFEAGQITARETIAVIGAGLRGAGGSETDADIAAIHIEGGATGAIRLVADLLRATFVQAT